MIDISKRVYCEDCVYFFKRHSEVSNIEIFCKHINNLKFEFCSECFEHPEYVMDYTFNYSPKDLNKDNSCIWYKRSFLFSIPFLGWFIKKFRFRL